MDPSSPQSTRNRGQISNSVMSFMKKIVNKNTLPESGQYCSPASTPSQSAMSSPSPAAMSFASSTSSNASNNYNNSGGVGSTNRGPLIHKLKQKMATHSSRMMASLTSQPLSGSSLSTDQLTAHLTEEERVILQKVFQKEEQFREFALKGLKSLDNIQSPMESPKCSPTLGNCRICRKIITEEESYHICSNCHQYVCDDCSSYSSRDESKYWMCSFCRRRGSHLIPTSELLGLKRVPSFTSNRGVVNQRFGSGDSTRTLNIAKSSATAQPTSPIKRRPSLSEQARQHSLEGLSSSAGTNERQYTKTNGQHIRRSRSRPCSPPERYSSVTASDKYGSSEALSDRRSSCESSQGTNLPPSDSGFKSRDEFRKSYSASDSSVDDNENNDNRIIRNSSSGHHRRRRSRKSKIHRQKGSFNNEEEAMTAMHNNSVGGHHSSSLHQLAKIQQQSQQQLHQQPQQEFSNESQFRHVVSEAMIYARNGFGTRKSSESSDVSDMRYSPPPESLTPSSEYSRSPRESADSDMLGLPTYPNLQTQRRSIPSVLVDVVDTNHLTLKDCFPRRGSTGRALPKIPVEPSRSMLDLPHSRKSSSHSLDLPIEHPRRASAPEGENIRIVIDDVDCSRANRNSVTQFERVILHRDETDNSTRTRGFGLSVIGGKLNESDGMLYAYVAWIQPAGPAEKMALKAGDKILEWDGKSLINCSYEQVCHIMDSSTNTAELIIESVMKSEANSHFVHQRRRLSQMLSQASVDLTAINQSSAANVSNRRRLPRTPESLGDTTQGQILLKVDLDTDHKQLTITIAGAKKVVGLKYPAYAQIHILPELGFKVCKTEPSLTLEWNETLIFQQFPVDKVSEMALEISIWENPPAVASAEPKPLASTVIPLRSAIFHHIDWWPLLAPNSSISIKASSMEYIALNPHEDIMINGSRSMPGSRRNSNRSFGNVEPYVDLSQQQSKTSLVSSGGRSSMDESILNSKRTTSLRLANRHSVTELNPVDATVKELIAPQYDSRTRRKSSSALVQSKLNRSYSLKSDRNNSLSTDSVGSASDLLIDDEMQANVSGKRVGDIKLGFIMTKGFLEIEVICARCLPLSANQQPPDTYVKIYLYDKGRQMHKRKTRVITNDCNPQYRQTLKYDAAMIYGRTLLVSIWGKQKGFDHNTPIGATEIHVNQLEFHKLTIRWYKLDTFDNVKQFSD